VTRTLRVRLALALALAGLPLAVTRLLVVLDRCPKSKPLAHWEAVELESLFDLYKNMDLKKVDYLHSEFTMNTSTSSSSTSSLSICKLGPGTVTVTY
jgi:hypothetical protein